MSEPRSKNRQKPVVAGLALLAALIAVRRLVDLEPKPAGAAEAVAVTSSLVPISIGEIKVSKAVVHPRQATGTAAIRRDPFNFESAAGPDDGRDIVAAGKALQLKFISKSDSQTLCRINDVLLREKQQINGFTVDSIGEHSVIVHREKYRFELRENHAD